jgi:ParB family transcriptional regulator, chromosome partitioning protein
MAAVKVGMGQLFGDVGQAQQLHKLRAQLEQLQAENERLKTGVLDERTKATLEQQVEELTAQLAQAGGEHEIAVALIESDPNQPRTAIADPIVRERAVSLQRHGQKTPIVLFPPQMNGRYALFDGEIRWRAAQSIGWKTLRAVIVPNTSDEVEKFEGQIVTGIHSQKLHDLDLANALLHLIGMQHSHLRERRWEIPKILNTAFRRLQRQGKHLQLAQIRSAPEEEQQQWIETVGFKDAQEQAVFATLLRLQLNPITINNVVFPLLNLAPDLKQAINAEGLDASKARELNRLSSQQLDVGESEAMSIRTQATQQVLKQKHSLNQVKELVEQLIEKYSPKSHSRDSAIVKFTKTVRQLDVQTIANLQDLEELEKVLQEKLAQIEAWRNQQDI